MSHPKHTESKALSLGEIQAPLIQCSLDGEIEVATDQARALVRRMGIEGLPEQVPPDLWREMERVPAGHAVQWRPEGQSGLVLGCTRYEAGKSYLLAMKEISEKQAQMSRDLHRQRLEATGRLAASVAHELRNAVASIIYCGEFLTVASANADQETMDETRNDLLAACRNLQFTVDGLLNYSRLGPAVSRPMSLAKILSRAENLIRALHAHNDHCVSVHIAPEAAWVGGNAMLIEQIFVNLLLNAIQAAQGPATIEITATLAPLAGKAEAKPMVNVVVVDSGGGISPELQQAIFDPFFTTRSEGTGLGLSNAREAAEAVGGSLNLVPSSSGARFVVRLRQGNYEEV